MTDVKIKCDSCKFVDGCVDYGWSECKKFTQKPSELITNEEWLRSATFEELAGAIYEWHSAGYTSGRVGLGLNPVTDVVEWLKQPHDNILKP